ERPRIGIPGGLRRPHRQTRQRRQDPARSLRHLRGIMNTETDSNGKAKGKGKNGTNGHSQAAQLDHPQLLRAFRAPKRGDFGVRLRDDLTGIDGQIAEVFNEIADMAKSIQNEAGEVCSAVGKEGQAARRMRRLGTSGGWAVYIANVNNVIEDLSGHANEIARV